MILNKFFMMRISLLITLLLAGFFIVTQLVFAGTLTNFVFSVTDTTPNSFADYTFSYTVETPDPNMILYVIWPSGFDVSGATATVLIDGVPATINELAKSSTSAYIRLDTTASPVVAGANVVVTFVGVVNPMTPGNYNFTWVQTADPGGNALDTPATYPELLIEATFAGGDGTVGNPYQIASCTQLENMNDYLNNHFVLIQDINCSDSVNWNGGEGFDPVGDAMVPFTGSFNGAGHTITGLTINRPAISGVGLFGTVANGVTLRNVWLENVSITGEQYTGAIVGNFGTTEGARSLLATSYAMGLVTGTTSSLGGLVGGAYSLDIENSFFRGTVQANTFDVGGLVGYSEGLAMENSYFVGTVTSENNTPYALVGWLAGTNPSILNSFWDAEASGPMNATNGSGDTPGLSTELMKTASNFTSAGWDFSTVWNMNSMINDGYPILRAPGDVEIVLDGEGTEEIPWRITTCMTITESGFYVLDNNISDVEGDCIVIEAHNVEIDGDNHTITGLENLGEQAIDSHGYDQIRIRNVVIDNFEDGIQLWDSQGPSSVVNSTITNMRDDGIEGQGMQDFRISNNTLSNITDDGIDVSAYETDGRIENTTITITENTITFTGSTGIEISWASEGTISNNIISKTSNDGIYIEDSNNIIIQENIITQTVADGIDINKNYEESVVTGVEITGNTISTAGDNGIEIDNVTQGLVSGNILTQISVSGIALYDTSYFVITENTITAVAHGIFFEVSSNNTVTANTMSVLDIEGLVIPETSFEFIEVNPNAAGQADSGDIYTDFGDYIMSADDDYFEYDLPFTFNYHGRDIVRISVNTNGVIELLETGEQCGGGSTLREEFSFDCDDRGSFQALLAGDVIFANMDDLEVGNLENDYLGVFNINNEQVVIEWYGTTYRDSDANGYDSDTHPIHFQVVLSPNGTIDWNMNVLQYESYSENLFTGAYDGEAEELYIAGFALDQEQTSYSGDFSGAGTFVSSTRKLPFIGISLQDSSNSNTITGNFLTASTWIENTGEGNIFNTSSTGNTYYFTTGLGAWTQFVISDTDNNGFADTGSDLPFSEATLGIEYWEGEGFDAYPATQNRSRPAKRRSTSGGFSRVFAQQNNQAQITQLLEQIKQLQALLAQLQGKNTSPASVPEACESTTLRQGMRGQCVQVLQQLLNVTPQSGIFGPLTLQAVRQFQQQNNLTADGIVGRQTWGKF